jgi:hypothetical protein
MLTLASAAALAAASPAPCAYNREAMLALSPRAFDQDPKGGWRPLADRPACLRAAAELLAAYRTAHWGTLKPGELHLSYWHQGQVLALAGDGAAATPYLMAGVRPEDDLIDFADYAIGTVAFLQHDREGLVEARQRLAARPPPSDWSRTVARFEQATGRPPAWPVNLDVLDGFLACFDRPYVEAYGRACRPKPPSVEPAAAGR